MLSDRSYMRDSYGRQTTTVVAWTVCALVAGFILQMLFARWLPSSADQTFVAFTALSPSHAFERLHLWTFVTYAFVQPDANPLHLIFSCVMLYFVGRELLPLLGEKRLAWLFISATILGGLLWFCIHQGHTGSLAGASAAVSAFVMLFACLNPNREMRFLVFFILPVTLRPKHVAWTLLAVDLAIFFFVELPSRSADLLWVPSAHLGGMLAGLLYYQFVHLREWQTPDGPAEMELPKWLRKAPQPAALAAPKYKVQITTPRDLRAEVDRILDKINSEGFASLTDEEKRVLDDARDTLSRR